MPSGVSFENPQVYNNPPSTAGSYPQLIPFYWQRKALIDLVKCNERSGYKLLNNVSTGSMIAWLEKQNPAWSEKDKNLLNRLIGVLDGTNEEDYHEAWEEKFLPWLKSLKERMQPQSRQYEHLENYDEAKLDVLKFIRKETCCGLAEANNALLKLIKVLKEHPSFIMDKPRKLKIEWEEQK